MYAQIIFPDTEQDYYAKLHPPHRRELPRHMEQRRY